MAQSARYNSRKLRKIITKSPRPKRSPTRIHSRSRRYRGSTESFHTKVQAFLSSGEGSYENLEKEGKENFKYLIKTAYAEVFGKNIWLVKAMDGANVISVNLRLNEAELIVMVTDVHWNDSVRLTLLHELRRCVKGIHEIRNIQSVTIQTQNIDHVTSEIKKLLSLQDDDKYVSLIYFTPASSTQYDILNAIWDITPEDYIKGFCVKEDEWMQLKVTVKLQQ